MTTNITPALQIEDKKNLSAEEFKKQLCSWLENRGLLCELRAYFRSNMIEVLKNTTLGSSLSCTVKQTISPKMQAMNLLISEYLIYSQYHFSLCVFCTEVSLNNILQNANSTSLQANMEGTTFKFSEKEVYDILEALGILRHNQKAQKIYSSYCELNEPLISYFLPLSSLTSIILCEPIQYLEDINEADSNLTLGNICKLLSNSNMSPMEKSQLKNYVKLICVKEHEKHSKVIDSLKGQYKEQLKKYKNKLSEIHKSFDKERKNFQDEIVIVKSKLDDLQVQNHLKADRDLTEPKIVNAQGQQTDVITVEERGTQYIDEKQIEISRLDKDQQTLTSTSLESAVLQHMVQQLERENTNLRIDNFNYCERIDELANRASVLMTELNISQQHVACLNNLLQNSSSVVTTGSLLTMHNQIPHYTGAGEECSAGRTKPATPSNYRHLNRTRKSPIKKLPSSSENSSGTVTPTDDLLLEAKRKLRNLELESEDIDRKIRSFTERYDFAPSVNPAKNYGGGESQFKFNNELNEFQTDEIFEFGGCELQRNPNVDTEHELETSLPHKTTSNDDFSQSDVSASLNSNYREMYKKM